MRPYTLLINLREIHITFGSQMFSVHQFHDQSLTIIRLRHGNSLTELHLVQQNLHTVVFSVTESS